MEVYAAFISNLQSLVMGAILIASVISAIFSLLIWRSNVARDIIEQEKEIRSSIGNREHKIPLPKFEKETPDEIRLRFRNIKCTPDKERGKLKTLLLGNNGTTMMELSVHDQDNSPLDYDVHTDSIDRVEEIYFDSDPKMGVSKCMPRDTRILIYTTKPEAVKSKIFGFKKEYSFYLAGGYREKAAQKTDNST